jgi:hypothetical protein
MVNFVICNSEAIFGSSARRSCDHLSDQDYLIVDDNHQRRRDRKRSLEQSGWSVAAYTWSRLERLVDTGALFAQHLKQEALITTDYNNRLKETLSKFNPKPSYQDDFDQTCRLIIAVTSNVTTLEERNWCFDVLAVAVRNAGVLALADHGLYEFSYEKIIQTLGHIRQLTDNDIRRLLSLRKYKAGYRAGHKTQNISDDMFQRMCVSISKLTQGHHFSDHPKRSIFTYDNSQDIYLKSRLVEKDMLHLTPLFAVDQEEFNAVTSSITKAVVLPRDYLWQFSKENSPVENSMRWLQKNTIEIIGCNPASVYGLQARSPI